jgi:hypothetical protein
MKYNINLVGIIGFAGDIPVVFIWIEGSLWKSKLPRIYRMPF